LGCKANWSDSEAIGQSLAREGLCIVDFEEAADVYVVNTCTVTALASAQSRQMLRRALTRSPNAAVIATGCCGEVAPADLKAIPGLAAVFGTKDRKEMIGFILGLADLPSDVIPDAADFGLIADMPQSRARAFLKIQDGCQKSCAYCIIARARGGSRSLPQIKVQDAARVLGRRHREIILAGIDIGQYGLDLSPRTNLLNLVRLLASDPEVPRLRLSSLSPCHAGEALAETIAGGGVCRHVHLSIQSGSDEVLVRMRRGYRARDAAEAAERLWSSVPGIAITGDVIAGLPGETEIDHRATLQLLESMPLASLHVFPYSPREGTDAASMQGQVPHSTRTDRAAELRSLAERKREDFLKGLIGKELDVIVTSREPDGRGMVEGFSDNAISIALPGGCVEYGLMGQAAITRVEGTEATGEWR